MKNIKIMHKLVGGFSLAAIIAIFIGIQDRFAIEELQEDMRLLVEEKMDAVEAVLRIEVEEQRIRSNISLILGQILSAEERKEVAARITERQNVAIDLVSGLKMNSGLNEETKGVIGDLEKALEVWKVKVDEILAISSSLVRHDVLKPDRLANDLQKIASAHHELMAKTSLIVFTGNIINTDADADLCPLGQWLRNFSSNNKSITEIIDRLKPIHYDLHSSVSMIRELTLSENTIEARHEYEIRAMSKAQEVFGIFEELLDISANAQASFMEMENIYTTQEITARAEVQKQLDRLVELINSSAVSHIQQSQHNAQAVELRSLLVVCFGSVLTLAIGIVLARAITGGISKGVALAQAMADGDLTYTIDVKQKDEIGTLANALNSMVLRLRDMLGDVASEVKELSAASYTLTGVSVQMADGASSTVERAQQVATAAEEMSANQISVAAAMEQASTNVNTVAAAAEEMSATIEEIASNSAKAKSITDQAVVRAGHASTRIQQLGAAAQEIGKVTKTIAAISSQTNLLALNATIEASRAGTAGRGFAVVANEIKELAQQTARATEDIRVRIQDIQNATGNTVMEIDGISEIIVDIDHIVSTIAVAVEEQTATTREIANNVGQASQGIADVNFNVSQSSVVSGEIATDIADVSGHADQLLAASEQVKQSATRLHSSASNLNGHVSRFTLVTEGHA
ncbi:methyl-accepting chemotaxis protein [Desulfomicrobium salsuginis]